jgi:hypothetical protein
MWLKACLIADIRVKVWRKGRGPVVKKKIWMKNVMSISRHPSSTHSTQDGDKSVCH